MAPGRVRKLAAEEAPGDVLAVVAVQHLLAVQELCWKSGAEVHLVAARLHKR